MIINTNKNTAISRSIALGKIPPKSLDSTFDKDQMVEGQSVYIKESNAIAEYIKFGNTIYKTIYETFRTHTDSNNKWFPQLFNCGFNDGTTGAFYIPLNGSLAELSSTTSSEYNCILAPWNGRLSHFSWRSENDMSSGNWVMKLFTCTTNTEFPGTEVFSTGNVAGLADDTTMEYKGNLRENTYIKKGDLLAIQLNPPADTDDTVVSVVVEWDVNS
jgi:hypothetical protein